MLSLTGRCSFSPLDLRSEADAKILRWTWVGPVSAGRRGGGRSGTSLSCQLRGGRGRRGPSGCAGCSRGPTGRRQRGGQLCKTGQLVSLFHILSNGRGKGRCAPALLFVVPSSSIRKTKAGRAKPGTMAMEMWMMPLQALEKTLSLLWKTRVTCPN
jgi:hypothetical protein